MRLCYSQLHIPGLPGASHASLIWPYRRRSRVWLGGPRRADARSRAQAQQIYGAPGIVKRYRVSLRASPGELHPSEIGASGMSFSGSKAKK